MKILHVCNHFYPCIGGIETYIMNLSSGLIKRGHKSDVLCLNTCHKSSKKLPESEEHEGICIRRIPYLDLHYYKIAPSVIRHLEGYDIIHVHGTGFFSDYLAITKLFHKKKMILSTYGGVFHTKNIMAVKKIYFFGWCRLAAKSFQRLIVISREDEKIARKISDNVDLVDAGIDYELFSSVKKDVNRNVLAYVGRISKNKRIDNIIKTVSYLKKDMKDVTLYIIGDDWENIRADLESLAKDEGIEKNVIFTGRASDKELLKYLAKANFFVSASEYESFGLSVVESMAAGCIPVLNNIEIFKTLITDGKDGFIADFNNPQSAAEKIRSAFKSNLGQIRKNSKELSKKYGWDKKVLQIEKIYIDAMKNSGGAK